MYFDFLSSKLLLPSYTCKVVQVKELQPELTKILA